jgi:CHAD domain-containing protein
MGHAAPITAKLWLEHLMRQVRDVRAGQDSEAVHQIRVAIARLRRFATADRPGSPPLAARRARIPAARSAA